jgi:hypothetical protein
VGFLEGLPDKMLDAGKAILGGLWDGIKWIATNGLYDYFIGFPLKILGWLGDLASLLLPVGKAVLSGLWDGIKWVAENVLYQYFVGIPLKILDLLKDANLWLFDKGVAILKGLASGIVDGFSAVVTWFFNLPGAIWDLLAKAGDWLIETGKKIIEGLVKGIKAAPRAIIDAIASLIPGKGILGDIAGSIGGLIGLAGGGPVMAGHPYIVGENGPELFMPSGSGSIVPNGQFGIGRGGTTVNATIIMPVGSNGDDVVRAIRQFEKRNGPGWRS